MEASWRTIVAGQGGTASPSVKVRPGRLTSSQVSVTVEVEASAAEDVWFSDGAYGATAWSWDGSKWRRIDTAQMRTMIAPSLGPGGSAEVTLPIDGVTGPTRVLVQQSWVDVGA